MILIENILDMVNNSIQELLELTVFSIASIMDAAQVEEV